MTTEDFIKHVKRMASIPTSQITYASQDFMDLLNGEMQTYILPWIDALKEEFFLWDDDQAFSEGAKYRIHTRAVGCTLRDVKVISGGIEVGLDRVDLDAKEKRYSGYYVRGQHIHVIEPITNPDTVRLIYMIRPNRNVLSTRATTIASKTASTITLTTTPSNFGTPITFDIVRGKEPFDFPEKGIDRAGTLSGGVITVTDGNGTTDFSVGDYVCLAQETPVVQLPEPAAWLLVQQVVLRCLEGLGDVEGVQLAALARGKMEKDVAKLLTNRVKGDPQKIVVSPSHPIWRQDF